MVKIQKEISALNKGITINIISGGVSEGFLDLYKEKGISWVQSIHCNNQETKGSCFNKEPNKLRLTSNIATILVLFWVYWFKVSKWENVVFSSNGSSKTIDSKQATSVFVLLDSSKCYISVHTWYNIFS